IPPACPRTGSRPRPACATAHAGRSRPSPTACSTARLPSRGTCGSCRGRGRSRRRRGRRRSWRYSWVLARKRAHSTPAPGPPPGAARHPLPQAGGGWGREGGGRSIQPLARQPVVAGERGLLHLLRLPEVVVVRALDLLHLLVSVHHGVEQPVGVAGGA